MTLPVISQDFGRWRSRQRFTTAAQIHAASRLEHSIIQFEESETPERAAGLQEAFRLFETAMNPQRA